MPKTIAEGRLLYDRKEAARQLSISVRSLDYIIASKGLDTRRIGRKILVTRASLVEYARGNHYAITSRSDADAVASGDKCA
jgi:Helix-turn-helix domain